jgi:hypothetical protein
MLEQMSDPDYYYHVALSREIVTNGFPDTLPQAKDIGWDILFTDKEFLFHVITSYLYSLFGEAGVRATPLIASAITGLALTFRSIRVIGIKLFWLPLLIIALDPYFLRRMIMVRPQVLATLFFVLLLYGFIAKKKYLVVISAALFALSYHALQIPLLVIVASLFTALVILPSHAKYAVYCFLGLVVGSLIHPYFPGNLTILPQIVNIVLDTQTTSSLAYGGEIYPWKTNYFLKLSILPLFSIGFGFLCMGRASQDIATTKDDSSNLTFLSVLCCLLLAVSFLTPRGRDYLVPASVLLFIEVFRHIPVATSVLTILFTITQFLLVRTEYKNLMASPEHKTRDNTHAALLTIPEKEKDHVLNCNWSHSPFIYYYRPDLSFVDILDPSFLYLNNRPLHDARMDLINGKAPDQRLIVHDIFKAKYVLCDSADLNLSLDRDPHFERLFPKTPVSYERESVAVFKIKEQTVDPHYVRQFEYRLPNDPETRWTPVNAEVPRPGQEPLATSYLNFFQRLPKDVLLEKSADKTSAQANCIFVRPHAEELSKAIGSQYVILGGGPNLRLWQNKDALFESSGESTRNSAGDVIVPLIKPLKNTDSLVTMVCPGVNSAYFGITMSFWTGQQITETCSTKKLQENGSADQSSTWIYKGVQEKTCLGPLAAPKVTF